MAPAQGVMFLFHDLRPFLFREPQNSPEYFTPNIAHFLDVIFGNVIGVLVKRPHGSCVR
jgi:hypothetical protein